MKNGIRRAPDVQHSTLTTIAAPLPMPGRLAVSYHDRDLRIDVDTTLDAVKTGTVVTTAGTIANVRYLDPSRTGRVMIVLTGDDRNSAHISLGPDVVRQLAPALHAGTRLWVRGTVTRTIDSQPAGIDGRGVQVVNV